MTVKKKRAPKPMAPERMSALLLKLRKGADASCTLPQLLQVLDRIGGFAHRECVGVVEQHAAHRGGTDEAAVRAERERLATVAVVAWPGRGVRAGAPYYAEVGDVVAGEGCDRVRRWYFDLREGVGAEGVEVTADVGGTQRFFPSDYDLRRSTNPQVMAYEVLRWLKAETDYLERVSAALGMAPHVPAAERTVENTGSCPCCFRNIKLEPGRGEYAETRVMVLHGYERPGDGSVYGECVGRHCPPYELSVDGTRMLCSALVAQRDQMARYLQRLRAGEVLQLEYGNAHVAPESRDWARVLAVAISNTESEVKHLDAEIKMLTWLVDNWVQRPLPEVGSRVPNWKLVAWEALRKEAP